MYKKIFCLNLVFFICFIFYGVDSKVDIEPQDWQKELSVNNPIYEKHYKNIIIYTQGNNKELYASRYYYTEEILDKLHADIKSKINYLTDITLNENGFLSFELDNREYYYIPHIQESDIIPVGFIPNSMNIEKQKQFSEGHRLYSDICNAKTSSFLTETTKNGTYEYTADYIEDYFPQKGIILPWVEGVEGNGIYESIEFDSTSGDTLYILNGYVDPSHPELFKNNGRIKKAKIQVIFDDGSKENTVLDFLDFVYYKIIKFNNRIKHTKITILDVYPGKKYKDTCITRILTDRSFQR